MEDMKARKEAELAQLRTYADQVAKLAYWVATNENGDISHYQSVPYNQTHSLLRSAIVRAYPELSNRDIHDVVETWVDCGESIQYCVEIVKLHKAELAAQGKYDLQRCPAGHDMWLESGSMSDVVARHADCRRTA